jgi:hypothetical protein
MDSGWIKLWRKIEDSKIFYKPYHLQLFLYLVIKANHTNTIYRGIPLKAGQLLTGRKQLAALLNAKETTIYKRLKWLENEKKIELKSNNSYTIVTICNYETYQEGENKKGQRSNNEVTTKGQQGDTEKNYKNYKKEYIGGDFATKKDSLVNEAFNNKPPKSKSNRFTPPTLEEVKHYCLQRGNSVNPNKFVDHYTATNWYRGKNKIKDWKACVRTWENNDFNKSSEKNKNKNLSVYEMFKDQVVKS